MRDSMLALVKDKRAEGLVLKEMPIPQVGAVDVKIKIKKTAICGTDVHIWNWDEWAQETIKPPVITGHEYVGYVVEVGERVRSVKVGDMVSGEGHLVCGVCRNCRAGRRVLCRNTVGVGVNTNGAFAEYLVIPESNVVKILDGIPEEIVAIFDPFGNAVHTALKFNLIGEDVLITGAGPIGIMAAAVACHCGARNVVITDFNGYRLKLANKVAPRAVTVNLAERSLDNAISSLNMTEGFDVGLEMSGAASALNGMIDHMITGGKIALLGFQKPGTTINWNKFVLGSLTMRGIYGREMFETWYEMMSLIHSGLDLTGIITHHYDFRDFAKGFAAMCSGNSGKVILDWSTADQG